MIVTLSLYSGCSCNLQQAVFTRIPIKYNKFPYFINKVAFNPTTGHEDQEGE
jgi:hypothetical protein